MTLPELEQIAYFLRRVVARGDDEQLLWNLVKRIDKEIEKCRRTKSK